MRPTVAVLLSQNGKAHVMSARWSRNLHHLLQILPVYVTGRISGSTEGDELSIGTEPLRRRIGVPAAGGWLGVLLPGRESGLPTGRIACDRRLTCCVWLGRISVALRGTI